ncbi:hypothetical protein EMCRGX_G011647 [Ephydatia muelleri]
MRELGEATASLERSHDLETHLLKGNRTLQEQSVECEQPKEEYRAACHHDSPHCKVKRVTHPQDEPVTGSGRYRHSSMSPRQSTLQGEESDPPPRAACHHDSPHCRVKRVTHPQDEPVGVTATAACHHDSPHCRVQRVTHPQDEPVTGSGRYRHSSMSPRQSTLQGEESDPSPR